MRLKLLFFIFIIVNSSVLAQDLEDSLLRISESQRRSGKNKERALTEYRLGKYYYNEYEDSLCEVHLKNSIHISKKIEFKRTQAIATNQLGNLVSELGEHEQAIDLYSKAIELAKDNDTLKASFMNNQGLELKTLGKYKEAIDVLYKALQLKERIKSSDKSISSTLLNIGLIWDLLDDQGKALEFYEKSLDLKKKIKDSLGVSRLLSNISVIAKNKGDYENALKLIKESNVFNRGSRNYEQYYINHTNLGNIYKKQGKIDLFVLHFDTAHYYASELNNPDYLSDVHQNLGTYYFEQSIYDKAIEHLKEAIRIPGENINNVLLYENHTNLSKAYAALGRYNLAHTHLILGNQYRDSLFAIENQKAIQEINERYQTEKRKKELVLKDLELAEEQASSRKKTITLLWLIGGVVVLGLIATLGFIRFREKQRNRLIVAEQRLQNYREEIEVLRNGIQSHLNDSPNPINVRITQDDINQYLIDPLTERELEVLKEIAAGKTNKAIADSIFVSENTVKYHLKNVYLKLDVKNRTEAITKADALNVWKQA